jgi:hypothetical protein
MITVLEKQHALKTFVGIDRRFQRPGVSLVWAKKSCSLRYVDSEALHERSNKYHFFVVAIVVGLRFRPVMTSLG